MKFSQVNAEQIQQANEAIETIQKLKRALAQQRLSTKAFAICVVGQKLAPVNVSI